MDNSFPKAAIDQIENLESEVICLKSRLEKCYKSEQTKYRRLINATSEGYLELDLEFKIVDANSSISELTGLPRAKLLNSFLHDIYDGKEVFIHFSSKDHLSYEANIKGQNETYHPVLFKRSAFYDDRGKKTGYLVFLTELTELKKAQQELNKAKKRYKGIYKNASQGMYQCNLEGKLFRVNPAFAKIFGYDKSSELLSEITHISSLYKDPRDRQTFIAALKKNRVVTDHEVEMVDRNGKSVWVLINANVTTDTNNNVHIDGILINNTKRKYAEKQLVKSRERFRFLANHDNLTTLFNTRYLYKSLDKLIQQSSMTKVPFSLVFFDMDNFKKVVDTYGHLNGSQALKEVAATIKSCLVEPAYGVAYGGDEFVLVLPGAEKTDALKCVETIRQKMKNTVYLSKKGLSVELSASYGVATYPDDASESGDLLTLADEAMFHIKSHGKDAVGVTD